MFLGIIVGRFGDTSLEFESNISGNLYKIWNRMSSGSYMPPEIKGVPIPKKSGGTRILGIPTVGDRVAQTVVKLIVEPELEKTFLPDSYGYRPGKSAHDALRITRKRCWKYNWVLEFDICGLFDNLNHDLLMKAVNHHVRDKWCILYIERWIKAKMVMKNNDINGKEYGVPQGGVISPVLSNLFLHYTFDYWLTKKYPEIPWCRYADDGLLHCKSKRRAEYLLGVLTKRFKDCGLTIHPEKTKIVYCKDSNRQEQHQDNEFTFLGYTFKQRSTISESGQLFMSFLPAISNKAMKEIKRKIKFDFKIDSKTGTELIDIAQKINPIVRGWIQYYGKFYISRLNEIGRYINLKLSKWYRKRVWMSFNVDKCYLI